MHIAWLFLTAVACGQSVTLQLTPPSAYPGDTIRLIARMQAENFAEISLTGSLPEGLRYISKEASPVQLHNDSGKYAQSEVWILQAMYPGEFTLSAITAEILEASGQTTIPLPPQTLTVLPYSDNDEDFTPIRFEQTAETHSAPRLWPYGLLALSALFVIIFSIQKSRQKSAQEESATVDDFDTLMQDLRSGHYSDAAIEKRIHQEPPLSAAALLEIERIRYAKTRRKEHP